MTKETGMFVQKLRLRRGWSQEQLAELCALSVRTIQRVEQGQKASAESLKALASVFEVDFLDLKEAHMNKPTVTTDEALALTRVRKIKGFYIHLFQFAAVIAVLAAINVMSNPRYLWVGWVALGWGSGVLVHGLKVFDRVPFFTAAWEKRRVEQYLGRQI